MRLFVMVVKRQTRESVLFLSGIVSGLENRRLWFSSGGGDGIRDER